MFYKMLQYEITDDGLRLVATMPSNYDGPAHQCKKGDKQKKVGAKQEALAGTDIGVGKQSQAIQGQYRGYADPFMKSQIPTDPNAMSPYAAAQYGGDVENIARTYQNLRQAGFRALGARGFGNAPAGFESSITNNLLDQQGRALTSAYRTGIDRTTQQGINAADYFQRGQGLYNPVPALNAANNAYTGATGSYNAGDQGVANSWRTGIGAATGIASMVVPGGGFANLFKQGGQKSPSGLGPTYGDPSYGGLAT